MKITTKQARVGYVFLILSILLLVGYWYYLLEPLQIQLIENHKVPTLVGTITRSVGVATLFSLLTFLGGALSSFASAKWTPTVNLKFLELIKSKVFLKWATLCNFSFLIFSLLWKYGNF